MHACEGLPHGRVPNCKPSPSEEQAPSLGGLCVGGLAPDRGQLRAQVLFAGGKFQWKRLENLIRLAREGSGGLDLSDTVASGARVVLLDERLRSQLLLALTEDNRLHVDVRHSSSGVSPPQEGFL